MTKLLRTSSSVTSEGTDTQQYKSLDRFGSIDSSDTFLSCATHPFPSQGSLAGLEELAAVGSMNAQGSNSNLICTVNYAHEASNDSHPFFKFICEFLCFLMGINVQNLEL